MNETRLRWEALKANPIKDWEWWELTKEAFKTIAIRYSKSIKKDIFQKIKDLEKGIKQINCLIDNSSDNSIKTIMINERNVLKNQIDELYKKDFTTAIARSKCDILTHNENPSSFFLRAEVSNAKQTAIKELKKADGGHTKNTEENLIESYEFYQKLYKAEKINNNEAEFFTRNLPQVPRDITDRCDMILSNEEIERSMRSMSNGKSPGSDGLTIEFYKFFWKEIGNTFCDLVRNNFEDRGHLSKNQKLGIIRLIPKISKYKDDLKNYRPMSLLNTD